MNYSNGKFIITGEHSVVYGQPAVVSALEKRISASIVASDTASKRSTYEQYILELFSKKFGVDTSYLELHVDSQLPQKSGLGSSAAFACAVIKELAEYFSISLDPDELFNLVLECENFIHKKSSGIDPCAVVYGGIHSFQKDTQTDSFVKQRVVLPQIYEFLLINSGAATESTGEMVASVEKRIQKTPSALESIHTIGKISSKIQKELTQGTFDGTTLDENQEELEKLQVVGKTAQEMILRIRNTGSSAKITGAGGVKTGSGWILAYDQDLSKVEQLSAQNTWETIKTEVQ